jgi:hypothetical protein
VYDTDQMVNNITKYSTEVSFNNLMFLMQAKLHSKKYIQKEFADSISGLCIYRDLSYLTIGFKSRFRCPVLNVGVCCESSTGFCRAIISYY